MNSQVSQLSRASLSPHASTELMTVGTLSELGGPQARSRGSWGEISQQLHWGLQHRCQGRGRAQGWRCECKSLGMLLSPPHLGPRSAALRPSPFCTVLLAWEAGPGPGWGVVFTAGDGTQVPEEMDIRDGVKTRTVLPCPGPPSAAPTCPPNAPLSLPSSGREGVKLPASQRECGAINTHSQAGLSRQSVRSSRQS